MLFVKVLAAVGALMGIYGAAALQNGPEVTDANLCKLLRRISASIPDQCIPSLDNYGTAIAAIIVFACVILLLWDFRKHVFVSRGFTVAIKRLWAKVDPYLIPIGLGIIIFGAVILSYGAYKQSVEAKGLRAEFSKIEVLLASAQKPRQQKPIETYLSAATTRLATAEATDPDDVQSKTPIKPRYNDSEIRKLIDVMAALREIIDGKIAPKTWELSEFRNNWERSLKEGGAGATSNYVKTYAEPIRTALNDINKILYDNRHYEDHVRPTLEGFGAISSFHSATLDLAAELNEYANAQNVNVAKIVSEKFKLWIDSCHSLEQWMSRAGVKIAAKTKELREWNP